MKKSIPATSKRPLSLTLILIWMVWIALSTLPKLLDMGRFELNRTVLGSSIAILNYTGDFITLVMSVLLIVAFVKMKKNSWVYFIAFMIFLALGAVTSFFYLDEALPAYIESPADTQFVTGFFYVLAGLFIVFYLFLAYVVYRKRSYFKK